VKILAKTIKNTRPKCVKVFCKLANEQRKKSSHLKSNHMETESWSSDLGLGSIFVFWLYPTIIIGGKLFGTQCTAFESDFCQVDWPHCAIFLSVRPHLKSISKLAKLLLMP